MAITTTFYAPTSGSGATVTTASHTTVSGAAFHAWFFANSAIDAFTNSGGDTWTLANSTARGDGRTLYEYRCAAITGTSNTFTVDFTTSGDAVIYVAQVQGGTYNSSIVGTSGFAGTPYTTGSLTLPVGALGLAFFTSSVFPSVTPTISAPFTAQQTLNTTNNTSGIASMISASSSSYAGSWDDGGAANVVSTLARYDETAGGGISIPVVMHHLRQQA